MRTSREDKGGIPDTCGLLPSLAGLWMPITSGASAPLRRTLEVSGSAPAAPRSGGPRTGPVVVWTSESEHI